MWYKRASEMLVSRLATDAWSLGRVAESADARDLKSLVPLGTCGFKSRLGHCFSRQILRFRLQTLRRCGGNNLNRYLH